MQCPMCMYPFIAFGRPCGSCGYVCEGCFVTTAVCECADLSDDCHALSVLRGFRDSYMMETTDRVEKVEEYYRIAPLLVERINENKDCDEIYNHLRNSFILPTVKAVEDGENERAETTYKNMMSWLKKRLN